MDSNNHFHQFPGFFRPTTTPIPDELFDRVMHHLTGAELKVVMYICRRTFGFKKDSDTISLNQIATGITTKTGKVLDEGTGLSKRHVQRALKTLEEKNIIKVSRRVDETGINEVNNYSLNVIDTLYGVGTKSPQGGDKMSTGVETPMSPGVETPASTTTNSLQETENNNDDVVQALLDFGISEPTARKFGKQYPEDYLAGKIAWAQWLLDKGEIGGDGRNAAGFLRDAIIGDYKPAEDQVSPSQRKARDQQIEAAAEERRRQQQEYEKAKEEAFKAVRQNNPPQPIGDTGLTTATAWDSTLEKLKALLPGSASLWLNNTILVELSGKTAHVVVPNQFTVDWLNRRLYQSIARTLGDVINQDVQIEFFAADIVPAEAAVGD